jgi:hypothetical protein
VEGSTRKVALGALMLVLVSATFGAGVATADTAPAAHTVTWLAAGDSFASGAGLEHTTEPCAQGTGTGGATAKTWAVVAHDVLAKQTVSTHLDFESPKIVACTGAISDEFFHPYKKSAAQWKPPTRYDLVTFSFGGDDIGFSSIVKHCVTIGCPSDADVRHKISLLGTTGLTIGGKLIPPYPIFLQHVAKAAVTKGGNVVVMGYPEVVEDPTVSKRLGGGCEGFTEGGANEVRGWAGDLNATIGAAVTQANALPAADRNDVHFTFIDPVTGQGTNGISASDPYLFEPASGTRHELCSPGGKAWLNGLLPGHLTTRSFHPNQNGETAMGDLAAEVIPQLFDISETSAASELAALVDGMSQTLVAVPGGYEAATWDQLGTIDFWKLTGGGPWKQVGQSTYPMLTDSSGPIPSGTSVTGMLLSGMTDATFIAKGGYTGDGTGNYIAFTNSTQGWGTVAGDSSATTLVPTGSKSTDNSTPGIEFYMQFLNGGLQTGNPGTLPYGPDGEEWQVIQNYLWNGSAFAQSSSNLFTAAQTTSPPTNAPSVTTCPATPPDGTYSAEWVTAQTSFTSVEPYQPTAVTIGLEPGLSPSICDFTVSPDFPITIGALTSSGSIWITAPAWILTNGINGNRDIGDDLPGLQFTGAGSASISEFQNPYFIPPSLGIMGIAGPAQAVFTIKGGKLVYLSPYGLT